MHSKNTVLFSTYGPGLSSLALGHAPFGWTTMIWVSYPLSLVHGSNSLLPPGKKKKIKLFGNLRKTFCFPFTLPQSSHNYTELSCLKDG